jgi:hypothetical protein
MVYFFNMSYVVCYHLTNFELKTPLVQRLGLYSNGRTVQWDATSVMR